MADRNGLAQAVRVVSAALILVWIVRLLTILGQNGGLAVQLKSAVGRITSVIGVVVAIVSVVDFMLTRQSKERVADKLFRVWYWLDEQRKLRYPEFLWTPKTQRALMFVSIAAVLSWTAWASFVQLRSRLMPDTDEGPWQLRLVTIVLVAIGCVVSAYVSRAAYRGEHKPIARAVSEVRSANGYFIVLGGAVLSFAPWAILGLVLQGAAIAFPVLAFFCLIALLFLLVKTAEFSALVSLFVLSVTFLVCATIAGIGVRVSAVVLERILEYNKGVVLACSLLLSALGAMLSILK